jgi:hypothetical protein
MKHCISIVTVAALMFPLAMAAPALAFDWDGEGGDGLWNTKENWRPDYVPDNDIATINNGDSVVVARNAPGTGRFVINGGSTLTIKANIFLGYNSDTYIGGDDETTATTAGTVIQTGGIVTNHGRVNMDDGGVAEYHMDGGTFSCPGYFAIGLATSLLEISGGSFTVGADVRWGAGTIRVQGYEYGPSGSEVANAISFDRVQVNTGILDMELRNGSTGLGIATINVTGAINLPTTLNVTLESGAALPAIGTSYDLISAGSLIGTIGTENLPTNWELSYPTGNQIVQLTYVPEPATMSLLAIGGLALIRRRKRA